MNSTNFQKELDKIIETLTRNGEVPSLLLHSCCAPCSSYTLEYLSNYFKITLLYYNPNIAPAEEYEKRVKEQERLIHELTPKHPIQFIAEKYEPHEFYDKVRGLEKEPEGGERCFVCYRLRMERAAQYAKKLGCNYFTTTLTISPLKNAEKINEIGNELSGIYHVNHLPSDFKKKGGYQRSIQLSKEHNLYRQNYCGCIFSKRAD